MTAILMLLATMTATAQASSCPHETDVQDKFSHARGHTSWAKVQSYAWFTFIFQDPPAVDPATGESGDKWIGMVLNAAGLGAALPKGHELALLLEDSSIVELPSVGQSVPSASVSATEYSATVITRLQATYLVSDENAKKLTASPIDTARLVFEDHPLFEWKLSGGGSKNSFAAAQCVWAE